MQRKETGIANEIGEADRYSQGLWIGEIRKELNKL